MSAQPNEELKPCPMKSSHPYGATEVRELMPDYWMVQCLTAQHHVSVSGYKTKELAIEAWNRRSQEAPVAQVEVYRKALEMISQHEDCLCEPGMEVVKEALLTSKPEPVAPVVKTDDLRHLATELLNRIAWEAEHENNHQTVGIQEACKQLQEELEKEAPVAPVRKV